MYQASTGQLLYELTPGWKGYYESHVKINSYGFRGKEIDLEKTPFEKRILILGDSFVFGQGIDESDGLASQLEEILQKKMQDKIIRVINAGVPGYNTVLELEALKKYLHFKPDIIVVIYLLDNDSDIKPGLDVDEKTGRIIHPKVNSVNANIRYFFHEHSRAFNFFYVRIKRLYLSLRLNHIREILETTQNGYDESGVGWINSRKALETMHNIARAQNLPFIVGGIAFLQNINCERVLSDYCKQSHINYVSLWKTKNIDECLKKHVISVMDPHPNAYAHRIIAEKLAEKVSTFLK